MRSSIWRSGSSSSTTGSPKWSSTWTPDEVAVEETFVNKDAQATLKLGQARAMSLLVPAMHNLPVAEYGANQVKKTVVGVGHADKNQVLAMVKILLPKADPKKADAADALAIAICHAHQRKARALAASSRVLHRHVIPGRAPREPDHKRDQSL